MRKIYWFFFTSSIFLGSWVPKVSGSKIAKSPPTNADPPMMMKGKGPSMPASNGETMLPTLAKVEVKPTAELRIWVGYSSAVYK